MIRLCTVLLLGTLATAATAVPPAPIAGYDPDPRIAASCDDPATPCALHGVLDTMAWVEGALLGGVGVGGLAALVSLIVGSRTRTARRPRRRPATVLAGPMHADGVWLRLVDPGDGSRRIEVLGPRGWVAADRDPASLLLALRSAGVAP